ncbi:MAG: von Willebrand factor type A domain-containing protein [Planctomycetes bacterium]|nr:von Willebrand factor type A domain-containing protein [Planctomycetota bacterium]
MPCDFDRVLIDAYADGELSPEEIQEVEGHMAVCNECHERLMAVKGLSARLKTALRLKAPAAAVEGFLTGMREESAGRAHRDRRLRFFGHTWRVSLRDAVVFGSMAACLLLVLVSATITPLAGAKDSAPMNYIRRSITGVEDSAGGWLKSEQAVREYWDEVAECEAPVEEVAKETDFSGRFNYRPPETQPWSSTPGSGEAPAAVPPVTRPAHEPYADTGRSRRQPALPMTRPAPTSVTTPDVPDSGVYAAEPGDRMDMATAHGDEDDISDIPIGGTGTVGIFGLTGDADGRPARRPEKRKEEIPRPSPDDPPVVQEKLDWEVATTADEIASKGKDASLHADDKTPSESTIEMDRKSPDTTEDTRGRPAARPVSETRGEEYKAVAVLNAMKKPPEDRAKAVERLEEEYGKYSIRTGGDDTYRGEAEDTSTTAVAMEELKERLVQARKEKKEAEEKLDRVHWVLDTLRTRGMDVTGTVVKEGAAEPAMELSAGKTHRMLAPRDYPGPVVTRNEAAFDPANPRVQNVLKMLGAVNGPVEEQGGEVIAESPPAPPEEKQFVVLEQKETEPLEQQAVVAESTIADVPTETKEVPVEGREVETLHGAVFKEVPVNAFVLADKDRFSTFSLDVDTASYSLAKRYISAGYLPPRGAVRMEEFINAFDYNYPRRSGGVFHVDTKAMPSPFGEGLTLLRVGVVGRVIGREARKPANLVFVVDSSGSMDLPDRLPLLKYSIKQLVGVLAPNDRVSVVTYGTRATILLEAASASDTERILAAVDSIKADGSTNMLEGLALGYEVAQRVYVNMSNDAIRSGRVNKGIMSRVMLLSDGVANMGSTEAADMLHRVERYKEMGITFNSTGFGVGSYNDAVLEELANRGDGSYQFIGSYAEARRVFGEEMSASLQTIAYDAKIQVEFDPRRVRRYRLIGYENRDIADKDFRNDAIDAGEVGSGQSATALYELEVVPAPAGVLPADIGTVYVRYRDADSGRVEEISSGIPGDLPRSYKVEEAPRLYLAAAVAEFAEILRESEHASGGNLDDVMKMLSYLGMYQEIGVGGGTVQDPKLSELIWLVKRAKGLPRAQ